MTSWKDLQPYLRLEYWQEYFQAFYYRVLDPEGHHEASEVMDYVVIALGSLLIGAFAGMVLHFFRRKSSSNTIAKSDAKLTIDTSFASPSGPNSGSSQKGKAALKSALKQTSNYQSESSNTLYNLEDFMLRLYRYGFVVQRIKVNEKKIRCIKINRNGELCIYKNFEEKDVILPVGKPYIRMDLLELRDCFRCEDQNSFIMEFKTKSFHFGTRIGLDTTYLVEGFKHLAVEIKADKQYIIKCKAKYQELKTARGCDNDNNSVATLGNGSTHSYASSRR